MLPAHLPSNAHPPCTPCSSLAFRSALTTFKIAGKRLVWLIANSPRFKGKLHFTKTANFKLAKRNSINVMHISGLRALLHFNLALAIHTAHNLAAVQVLHTTISSVVHANVKRLRLNRK